MYQQNTYTFIHRISTQHPAKARGSRGSLHSAGNTASQDSARKGLRSDGGKQLLFLLSPVLGI